MMLTDVTPGLLAVSTAVELAAMGGLAWLLHRCGRERRATGEMVETLRADLASLLDDAQRRAQTLEAALADREATLRALLADLSGAEARTGRLHEPQEAEPRRASTPPADAAASAMGVDPAEVRLLRDLEVSIGRRRAAWADAAAPAGDAGERSSASRLRGRGGPGTTLAP